MPSEEKLDLAKRVLVDYPDSKAVGNTLASVIIEKGPSHRDTVAGIADRLNANAEADYEPPPGDDDAAMTFISLNTLRVGISGKDVASTAGGQMVTSLFGGMGAAGMVGPKGPSNVAGGNVRSGCDDNGGAGGSFSAEGAGSYSGGSLIGDSEHDSSVARTDGSTRSDRRQDSGAGGGGTDRHLTDRHNHFGDGDGGRNDHDDALRDGYDSDDDLVEGGAGVYDANGRGLDPDSADSAAAESRATKQRVDNMKRRQVTGELSDAELAELQHLESKLPDLEGASEGPHRTTTSGGSMGKRGSRKHLPKGSSGKSNADSDRLNGSMGWNNRASRGGGDDSSDDFDDDAAAAAAEASRKRQAELKRRQAAAGELSEQELAELRRLNSRVPERDGAQVERAGRRGRDKDGRTNQIGQSGNVSTAEVGCQAGASMMTTKTSAIAGQEELETPSDAMPGKKVMPSVAVTSLCEIKFNRKGKH